MLVVSILREVEGEVYMDCDIIISKRCFSHYGIVIQFC